MKKYLYKNQIITASSKEEAKKIVAERISYNAFGLFTEDGEDWSTKIIKAIKNKYKENVFYDEDNGMLHFNSKELAKDASKFIETKFKVKSDIEKSQAYIGVSIKKIKEILKSIKSKSGLDIELDNNEEFIIIKDFPQYYSLDMRECYDDFGNLVIARIGESLVNDTIKGSIDGDCLSNKNISLEHSAFKEFDENILVNFISYQLRIVLKELEEQKEVVDNLISTINKSIK